MTPTVRRIAPELAAARLADLAGLDPSGLMSPADILPMCWHRECFELETGNGSAVMVLSERNGVLWVSALVGAGAADLTRAVDAVLRQTGARSVGFQTARRGLVRKTQRLGWRVAGYIMRRDQ